MIRLAAAAATGVATVELLPTEADNGEWLKFGDSLVLREHHLHVLLLVCVLGAVDSGSGTATNILDHLLFRKLVFLIIDRNQKSSLLKAI